MKELTLKQLYGYSIMNWEIYYDKLEKAEAERVCSFCRDVERKETRGNESNCFSCKINHDICGLSEDLYSNLVSATFEIENTITKLINALKTEYNKL